MTISNFMAEESESSDPVSHLPSVKEPKKDDSGEMIEAKQVKDEPMQEIKEFTEESFEDKIDVVYNNDQRQKFKKIEADSRQQLMAKHFSDKNVFGGNIFNVKVNIDGQTAAASRLPPYLSYLNPATFP